eukprot:359463-Chlamydomonas_euryale.AAC.3
MVTCRCCWHTATYDERADATGAASRPRPRSSRADAAGDLRCAPCSHHVPMEPPPGLSFV